MKKLLITMSLLFAIGAQASHFKVYEAKDMELTTKLLNLCPGELVEIMGSGGYSSITAAEYSGGETPKNGVVTEWTVEITTRYPAPFFHEKKSTLKIREEVKASRNTAMDAPGVTREVTCNIE